MRLPRPVCTSSSAPDSCFSQSNLIAISIKDFQSTDFFRLPKDPSKGQNDKRWQISLADKESLLKGNEEYWKQEQTLLSFQLLICMRFLQAPSSSPRISHFVLHGWTAKANRYTQAKQRPTLLHLASMDEKDAVLFLEILHLLTCNCCFSWRSQSRLVMDTCRLSWAVGSNVFGSILSGAWVSSPPALEIKPIYW